MEGINMDMKDLSGRKVKVSKNSITVKDDGGKTCGVVRNIENLNDVQLNKQVDYCRKLKSYGVFGIIRLKDVIIKNNEMWIMRNIKSKLFNQANGYFSEEERQSEETKDKLYQMLKDSGINVIECIFY
jgi:hypothetical protein